VGQDAILRAIANRAGPLLLNPEQASRQPAAGWQPGWQPASQRFTRLSVVDSTGFSRVD